MSGRKTQLRFIEWLAVRRTVPGVLDSRALRALGMRFEWRWAREGLLERLLRRLAMFADASGEMLIWRTPWEAEGAVMAAVPVAQGGVAAAQTTAPGALAARERSMESHSAARRDAELRGGTASHGGAALQGGAASQGDAALREGAAARGRTMQSTLASERRASMESVHASESGASMESVLAPQSGALLPMHRPRRALSSPFHSPPRSAGARSRPSPGSQDAVSVSNPAAAATGVTNAKAFASMRITVERALGEPANFGTRLHARYGGSLDELVVAGETSPTALAPIEGRAPLTHEIAPFPIPTSARPHEDIVLREPAIPSGQRGPNEMPARQAESGTQQSARSMKVMSPGSILTGASIEHPSALEHRPDSPAHAPLLLRKAIAAKSPEPARITAEPARITGSSYEVPHALPADARPMQANPALATQRASAPLTTTSQRLDAVQFDALIERLVARLEIEARRQGRFRWRS